MKSDADMKKKNEWKAIFIFCDEIFYKSKPVEEGVNY
jgi:hypothetical protein